MKLSDDGFDARRLRPRGPGCWRWRFLGALAALFAAFGVLLIMAGAATAAEPLRPGCHVRTRVSGLGQVELSTR